jgi:CRISPR/Cas system Type II protein with McrA/HNH and RuvC-like nuclease domain
VPEKLDAQGVKNMSGIVLGCTDDGAFVRRIRRSVRLSGRRRDENRLARRGIGGTGYL